MFNGKALDNKVAIVTGAGQGIGAAVAAVATGNRIAQSQPKPRDPRTPD